MSVEFLNSVGAPSSLDVKFFEEILENALLEAYVELKNITFAMACAEGDNYCSKIYRVKLTFRRESGTIENISVIVKGVIAPDCINFLDDLKFFLKERVAYSSILPRLEILLDNVKFGPKLYHSQKEPMNTLVFEDLSVLGYVMADRVKGLDLDHCKVVMQKIGQFHGISMIMAKKEPASMNMFQHGLLAAKGVNNCDYYEKHFGNCVIGLIELMSKWEGFEAITEKVKRYRANYKANLIKSQQAIDGEVKVLNHGDLWVNNVLFKYKDDAKQKVVDDAVFVDFQLSIYGSPAYDIHYFLYTSAKLEVLKENRDELLRTYYAAVEKTLKMYNYEDIPTFEDILTEVRRREFYGFFACTGILPGVSMEKSDSGDNNLQNFMDESYAQQFRKLMFASKRMQDTMRYVMKRFDEFGIFD